MTVALDPNEQEFRERLSRSGRLQGSKLTLAIDLDGEFIGIVETYEPPDRALPPGVYEVGIALRERMRGKRYGGEALALLTEWLFNEGDARCVQGSTDPLNVPMRKVFKRIGWRQVGPVYEFDREWIMYAITRAQWQVIARGD